MDPAYRLSTTLLPEQVLKQQTHLEIKLTRIFKTTQSGVWIYNFYYYKSSQARVHAGNTGASARRRPPSPLSGFMACPASPLLTGPSSSLVTPHRTPILKLAGRYRSRQVAVRLRLAILLPPCPPLHSCRRLLPRLLVASGAVFARLTPFATFAAAAVPNPGTFAPALALARRPTIRDPASVHNPAPLPPAIGPVLARRVLAGIARLQCRHKRARRPSQAPEPPVGPTRAAKTAAAAQTRPTPPDGGPAEGRDGLEGAPHELEDGGVAENLWGRWNSLLESRGAETTSTVEPKSQRRAESSNLRHLVLSNNTRTPPPFTHTSQKPPDLGGLLNSAIQPKPKETMDRGLMQSKRLTLGSSEPSLASWIKPGKTRPAGLQHHTRTTHNRT